MPKSKKVAVMAIDAVTTVNEVNKTNDEITVPVIPVATTSKVTLRIIQTTKSEKTTFEMETSVTAKKDNSNVKGLAKKTAYILADSLYTLCEDALRAREANGYYLTSFRPKAVFKVFIIVDSVCTFAAVNTKGADSIRLFRKTDKKDALVSRSVLVQKFALLAGIAQANQTFSELVSFELGVDSLLNQAETELKELQG